MTRTWVVGVVLVVVLVAGGLTAALVGPRPGTAPGGAPQAVPGSGAGPGDVVLSADAAAHPGAEGVLAQLQRYFDAINAGDYAEWQAAVAESRVEELSEQAWKDAYRSTRDGTIRIDRIDDAAGGGGTGGGVLVRVRFVSTQDVADAPTDLREKRICWRATLPMEGVPPRITSTRGGSSVKAAC